MSISQLETSAHWLIDVFHTNDNIGLATYWCFAIYERTESEVTKSKFKTEEEKVQNDNVELKSFTDVDIDERTEPEVTESKFKTEVEEKVQNDNVKLESFTDVDNDESHLQWI